jgi:hypothetical protein
MPFRIRTRNAGTCGERKTFVACGSDLGRGNRTGAQEITREEYFLHPNGGNEHHGPRVNLPKEYDTIADLQVSPPLATGLRETSRLADASRGSLGSKRIPMPHPQSGNYCGIEPEQWLLEGVVYRNSKSAISEAKRFRTRYILDFALDNFSTNFDFATAQSVFTCNQAGLLRLTPVNISRTLVPAGDLLFTLRVDHKHETQGKGLDSQRYVAVHPRGVRGSLARQRPRGGAPGQVAPTSVVFRSYPAPGQGQHRSAGRCAPCPPDPIGSKKDHLED